MSTGFDKINDKALVKVIGGTLPPDVMEHLEYVIKMAKRADKTVDQCVSDFYKYNGDFTKEHEDYLRSRWDAITA